MPASRSDIAAAAADALESSVPTRPAALVGFDGFVDSIVHMVDQRRDMTPTGYTRLRRIADFAARCAAAAGKSTNIEQVLIEDRFGGNGPLMAGAVARLGMATTYIGCVGANDDPRQVHPVFRSFAARCRRVVPIGPPSTTDCLEFDDGKLMFNNTAHVQAATWERVLEVVGIDEIRRMVGESRLLGIVNWSLLGGVPGIWRGLIEEVLPHVPSMPRRVFIDLSDPAKRTDADVEEALRTLARLNGVPGVAVTLGLNLAEAERIAGVMGVYTSESVRGASSAALGAIVRALAVGLRRALGLDCVVVHPREGAAAATAGGESAWFDGPFTRSPTLSTGAGDHFNAGFAVGQVCGLALEQCLAVGCAVSGAYVRDAESPDTARVATFLRALPMPE